MTRKNDEAERVLQAVVASVDRSRLASLLEPNEGSPSASTQPKVDGVQSVEARLTERMVLADILDDSILSARPGDGSYPLRALLGELGASLAEDDGFALATLLNAYFRVDCEEETRSRIGLEVSRLYYRFAEDRLEPTVRRATSPLLAQLLSTQLERVRLESVDHVALFDGNAHERDPSSDASAAAIKAPRSFSCRVNANGVLRVKASVRT